MKQIAVLGPEDRQEEFRLRIAEASAAEASTRISYFSKMPPSAELHFSEAIFDLTLDENPDRLAAYGTFPNLLVIGCAVKRSLAEMLHSCPTPPAGLVGINAIPTFLNRPSWEMSSISPTAKSKMETLADDLGVQAEWVEDRIGMVTPRILFMIINEACFTFQEGTATIADIDQAMKLGTNYPMGPFEWADKIGVQHIYEVLSTLRQDTGNGRYKISPLLKRYYLLGKKFY